MSNISFDNPKHAVHGKQFMGHPAGLYILFFTELWERFSYYGMRAILVLYMISTAAGDNPGLGWSETNALALYGWYTMLVYVMSIPGGIVADKWLGQKRTVLIGGLILVAGHGILSFEAVWAFYLGLMLIVLGVGGLKPNISTMVGGLYPPGDERRDKGFTIFYIGINIGALLAALIVGAVGETIGWHYGFGLAGIGMLLGQIVFMLGQKYLIGVGEAPQAESVVKANEKPHSENLFAQIFQNRLSAIVTILLIVLGLIITFVWSVGYGLLTIALSFAVGVIMVIYQDLTTEEKDRTSVVLISFLIVIVFWGAFEQAGGLMNIYTKQKIDRLTDLFTLDLVFFGLSGVLLITGIYYFIRQKKTSGYLFSIVGALVGIAYYLVREGNLTDPYLIPASVFQSVNAAFIILFGTVVANFWIWWQHKGKESSSLFKMAIGTIIMGIGFIFMAIASEEASAGVGAKGMLIWLILAYLFHTIGELCASPVALSFVTKISPQKYVSIMMGFYFAATGLGNKVAGLIGEASQTENIRVAVNMPQGLASDLIYNNEQDSTGGYIDLTAKVALVNNELEFYDHQEVIDQYFNFTQEARSSLKERMIDADIENENQLTATFIFDRNTESGQLFAEIEIFELDNRQEFRTFVFIFLFTAAFGILLLIFLRKLKRLTHGAEDKKGIANEEQEKYKLGDSERFKDDN